MTPVTLRRAVRLLDGAAFGPRARAVLLRLALVGAGLAVGFWPLYWFDTHHVRTCRTAAIAGTAVTCDGAVIARIGVP